MQESVPPSLTSENPHANEEENNKRDKKRNPLVIIITIILILFALLILAETAYTFLQKKKQEQNQEILSETIQTLQKKELPKATIPISFTPPEDNIIWYVDLYPEWNWSSRIKVIITNNTDIDLVIPTWDDFYSANENVKTSKEHNEANMSLSALHTQIAEEIFEGRGEYNALLDFVIYEDTGQNAKDRGVYFRIDKKKLTVPARKTTTAFVYFEASSFSTLSNVEEIGEIFEIEIIAKLSFGKYISGKTRITNTEESNKYTVKSKPQIVRGVKTYYFNE